MKVNCIHIIGECSVNLLAGSRGIGLQKGARVEPPADILIVPEAFFVSVNSVCPGTLVEEVDR